MQNQATTLPSFEDCNLVLPQSEAFKVLALREVVFNDDEGVLRDVTSFEEGAQLLDYRQAFRYVMQCSDAATRRGEQLTETDAEIINKRVRDLMFDPKNIAGLQFCLPGAQGSTLVLEPVPG